MAEPDDDLDLVSPPADHDAFSGAPRSARRAELVDRFPPRLRTHDARGADQRPPPSSSAPSRE